LFRDALRFSAVNERRNDNFGPAVQTLTGLLLDFVGDHEGDLPEHDGQGLCMDLVDVSEKLRIHANRRPGNRKIVLNDVSALGRIFRELVDALLTKRIQVGGVGWMTRIGDVFLSVSKRVGGWTTNCFSRN